MKVFINDVNGNVDKVIAAMAKLKEPPIGIIPKYIHNEKRLDDLRAAIARYFEAGLKIPVEWIEEYNDLMESKKQTI